MDQTYGNHLKVHRGLYWHHGIGIGNGRVVHFIGLAQSKSAAAIKIDTLEAFAAGGAIRIVEYARRYSPPDVVRMALSRVGENGYNAFGKNCEHFARWCMTGEHRSSQIEKTGAATGGVAGGTAVAGLATTGAVALGKAAGIKGAPAIMKGLKAAGLGTNATTGLIALAAAPAVAANIAIRKALPDDPMLPQIERLARKVGRDTTTVASIAGAAGSVGMVAVAGMPGLSAVGITTGLAEIGAAFGGGMLAGTVAVVAIPALLALGLGLLVYHLQPRPAVVVKRI
jgi:Lecithin retinol acyltransferase